MVDFAQLLAAKQIVRELDEREVPGEGLSWDRVLTFARTYSASPLPLDLTDLEPVVELKLNHDQTVAWERLQAWAARPDDRYFVLRGYAGTGKTYLMRMLYQTLSEALCTAPTNKAAKVLSSSIGAKATTIYSALGLKMVTEEDVQVLKFAEKPPYIAPGTLIVIDECSMVGRELYDFVDQVAEENRCKILYVGDPAQLPPVKEARSPTWRAAQEPENRAFLKQVMRYDNQLLKLATAIRDCIQAKSYDVRITDDNAEGVGVFVGKAFQRSMGAHTSPADWRDRKVIAWRNVTVARYNNRIRESFGFDQPFHDGDVLLMAEPLEEDGQIVATVDEEFVVLNVERSHRTIDHRGTGVTVDVWVLTVEGDGRYKLVVPVDVGELDQVLSEKAVDARNAKKSFARVAWQDFWKTKRAFHRVRYGYALTAHRAQGSTYQDVYVDQQDILANDNEREAMRCLYVAVTRAAANIYSF